MSPEEGKNAQRAKRAAYEKKLCVLLDTVEKESMIAGSCKRTILRTFTCNDAKLRRLLLWHQRHESVLGLCTPKHYHLRLRKVRVKDISKLRYTEKKDLVHALEVAQSSLRRFREDKGNSGKYKQQSITKYFFGKK